MFRDFQYAALQGVVTLQTMPGLNFFFTPLGKSFICRRAEDQGPLKLFRVSGGEMVMVGEMEMWNTKCHDQPRGKVDLTSKKCTDIKTNQRVVMPSPRSATEETHINVRSYEKVH